MTSSQLLPAKTATPDARRQDLGSPKSDELSQRPPAFELAAVKGRASRSSPPLVLPAGHQIALDRTGPDWVGLHWIAVSDRPCPTRGKKPPSAATEAVHPTHRIAGYDRPAQVSREHKLSFSNQPSLDSLAREEKTTPTPPTQQQPRNACTHAPACSHKLADELTRTGCPRSDPSARSPARRRRRLAGLESSADRIFPTPADSSIGSHNAGLLADSLTPTMRTYKPGGVSSFFLYRQRHRPRFRELLGSAFSSNAVKETGSICWRCPRPREARG